MPYSLLGFAKSSVGGGQNIITISKIMERKTDIRGDCFVLVTHFTALFLALDYDAF